MKIRIRTDGTVHALWSDAIDWHGLGPLRVARASHVEFCTRRQAWVVRAAQPRQSWRRILQVVTRRPWGEPLFSAATRDAALAWEADHFAPGGCGWSPENSFDPHAAVRTATRSAIRFVWSRLMNVLLSLLTAITGWCSPRSSVRTHEKNQAHGPRWSCHRRRRIGAYRRRHHHRVKPGRFSR